ncbi:hypothetical protein ABT093_09830 [Kitasatospora sp. NPDC002551]|uniref:hypothetical protein n=1 Tax=Kitasatospora sp. NPDC002551 TaxID=3154539 RepID=UPI00331802F4
MTCPDDQWEPDDEWSDALFTDDAEYDLDHGPVYPPWWRRPWPVWRENTSTLPALPDITEYEGVA